MPLGNLTTRTTLVALLLLGAGPAWAEGYLSTDFSVRRVGMRTVLAHPDDLTALVHNPAGLLLTSGTSIYLGYTGGQGDLGLRVYDDGGQLQPQGELSPRLYFHHLPYLAVASDFGLPWLRVATTLHLARARWLEFGRSGLTEASLTKDVSMALKWSTAVAFAISRKFNIGLAVDTIHATRRWALAATPENRAGLPAQSVGALLDRKGAGTGVAFNLGFHFRPVDALELGVSFATGTLMELAGEVHGVAASHTTTFAIPFQLAGGVNWQFHRLFQVALDLRMWHYQVQQEERTVYSDGLGEYGLPTGYGQSFAWSLGLLYEPRPGFEVMVGYEQDFSAATTRTYQLETPVHDGQTLGMGLRYEVLPGLRIGLAAARTWYTLLDIQDNALPARFNAKVHASMMEGTGDVQWTF